MKKTIAIITSDPKSINYEIIKKSIFFFKKKNKNNYLFIGSKKLFENNVNFKIKNNIVDIEWNGDRLKKKYLKKSFEKFFELYKKKKVHGLINLPLNKKEFLGSKYPGVTEFISKKFKCQGNETMLLYNSKFSVCPTTTHILVKDISKKITKKKLIKNFINIYNFYKKIIRLKKPKITFLGFNPHNGKDFKNLPREDKIIKSAIKYIRNKFNIKDLVSLPADTSFLIREDKKINSLIGCYHDQVLTTFKYINKYSAINITLGLPFLRVSPDHGVAEELIGKNKANPDSFLYALNFFEKFHKNL